MDAVDDHSGPGGGGELDEPDDLLELDSSGSGSSGSGSSGSGSDSSGSGSSGSGSGSD